MQFEATGLIGFWQFQDFDKRYFNTKEAKKAKVLTTNQLIGSFQVLAFGYCVSFFALTLEISFNFIKNAIMRSKVKNIVNHS